MKAPIRIMRNSPRTLVYSAMGPMLALALASSASGQEVFPPERDPTLREAIEPNDPTLPRERPTYRDTEAQEDLPGRPQRSNTNFATPRPLSDPRLNYPGRRKQAKKPLPRVEPYTSAPSAVRQDYVPPQNPPPPTYAQPAQIPRPSRPKLDETPYAPLGVQIGSLRLFPFVENSLGFDTNVNRLPILARGSTFDRLDAGFRAQSNWSVHELTADVTGAYTKFFSMPDADRPEGAGKINLRLDATRETKVNLELRGSLTTQRPGSPEFNVVATSRPAILSYGATAGVTHAIGRLETTVSALYDRTAYQDGHLSNGTVVPLSQNNFNQFGLRGRIGYELTPGVKPFVEVTADARERDVAVDAAGFSRNSTGLTLRGGSSFELTRTLTGEISGGMVSRKYADARLPELRGPTIDASLIWTASPLTTVTLRAATVANETTIPNASGYISRRASVEVNHALLRNLTVSGIAQWQRDQYQGVALSQDIFTGTMEAEYALTRSIVVKGSFTHERLKSSVPGSDYTANVYLLGLRLQR